MAVPSPLKPAFPAGAIDPATPEPPRIRTVIAALGMQPHVEGGYFVETDRDPALVASPFPATLTAVAAARGRDAEAVETVLQAQRPGFDPAFRNASTSIFYLVTPKSPQGHFHRNRARTVHTLHRGRGVYVLVHADEPGRRVESFVVGPDVARGERLQWVVPGGKYKASFLLPDADPARGAGATSDGLLISETVVPGFEYCDHDFLTRDGLRELLGEEKAKGLEWLVRE